VGPRDAFLLVSFGGPERPDEVMPFLENVTRGRDVPRARLEAVAEHYFARGGVSPINGQNRALLAAIEQELAATGHPQPAYFGNRNWHPRLTDAVQQMADDGVERAIAFVTSAFPSYSGCRQYLDDIERARATVGPGAPVIDKLPLFFDHPGFVEAVVARTAETLGRWPAEARSGVRLVFTAHSIPVAQARCCDYEIALRATAARVAAALGAASWGLAFQSRSGPPQVPWLEPDILDHLEALAEEGARDACVVPLGFVSDHMEVVHDLDTEAAAAADRLGLRFERAASVGTHPRFVAMVAEQVHDFLAGRPARPDYCGTGCCPSPARA
jgi:protoporphyrin/coproporphyrin ferrochelatase